MRDVAENLRVQARRAQRLVIWTDCDREGEYIGFEIESICKESNPGIDVYRARYSVVSGYEINRSMNNPDRLDRRQIAAVASRQEIDLRSGASLTRLQSMRLQESFPVLKSVISYGSCQFPTLGFVVEQYLRLRDFCPHDFWTLSLTLEYRGVPVAFQWDRNRLFDRQVCSVLYANCMQHRLARITSLTSRFTSKWKPLPLRTVEFQKKAAKALRLSSDRLMAIAESLYNQGYISYPRTETDQFDAKFDHRALLAMQVASPHWGPFADSLVTQGRYGVPRLGRNNDKAHPPIHPTKAGGPLAGDDARVYEFIVRSYLAACSQDAKGSKTVINAAVGPEHFHTQGVIVTERNYLDVYPYERWNEREMPDLPQGLELEPRELTMGCGKTTAPQLLSESDLIGTMDKNGIGTDATIHEHIKKILDRKYVIKMRDARFVPTLLGLSLVQGYDQIGLENSLTKPRLRALLEADLTSICEGRDQQDQVVSRTVGMFRNAFSQARSQIQLLYNVLQRNLAGSDDPFAAAPLPGARRADPATRRHGDDDGPRGSDDDDDDFGRPQPQGGPRGGGHAPYGGGGHASHGGGARGSYGRPGGGAPDGADEGPPCACNKPSARKRTTKAGPNQGRYFYTCGSCNFFAWADEQPPGQAPAQQRRAPRGAPEVRQPPGGEVDENPPICGCGRPAVVRTVAKDGPNKGRQFYCCPSSDPAAKCTFFIWRELCNSAGPEEAVLRCACGLIAIKDAAKNGANAGKAFYRCSKQVKRCTLFQWDGPAATGASAPGGNRCFKCGEEGHFSSACPSAGGGRPRGGGRGRGRGRGRGKRT